MNTSTSSNSLCLPARAAGGKWGAAAGKSGAAAGNYNSSILHNTY